MGWTPRNFRKPPNFAQVLDAFHVSRSGARSRGSEYDEALLRRCWRQPASPESAMTDDLSSLKDDMVAFILGHGMSRFQGYVTEDVHSVMWDPRDNPESWKDFVELAKKAGCAFLSMDEEILERDELDYLVQRLQQATYPSDDDIEEARWLRSFVNKTGFLQLGWPHQGIMFLYEVSTDWYERYQRLLDLVEDFGTLAVDGSDPDEEH
jgi:hypothetical protein